MTCSASQEAGKTRIRTAVVLASGMGVRLQGVADEPGREVIKPLLRVAGRPLLDRVLAACERAGFDRIIVVVGYRREEVESFLRGRTSRVAIETVDNPDYRKSNGISLWRGAVAAGGPFALFMCDHLFQQANLEGLLDAGLGRFDAVLAIDRKLDQVFDMDDATKVVAEGDVIRSIGKSLAGFNAVDSGMFLIGTALIDRLATLIHERGDASISDGMTALIAAGRMGAHDIGDGIWQDVDTPDMVAEAERLLAAGVFPA